MDSMDRKGLANVRETKQARRPIRSVQKNLFCWVRTPEVLLNKAPGLQHTTHDWGNEKMLALYIDTLYNMHEPEFIDMVDTVKPEKCCKATFITASKVSQYCKKFGALIAKCEPQ